MARAFKRPTFRFRLPKGPAIPRLPRGDEPYEDVFAEMTLQEHLEELRDRIVKVCLSIGAAFLVGLILSRSMLGIISEEAGARLDISSPIEPITLFMKMALYIAVGVTMPIIIDQLIAVLAPGLTRREKRILFSSLPFVAVLFIGGAAYAFFYAVPAALKFLSSFMEDIISWDPDGEELVNFYLQLMIGLGFSFQLPVIMFLLAKLNIVSVTRMSAYRRYAFVAILIIAALITPTPDPINLGVVAIPLYALYEVGIIIARIFAKPTRRPA